jgi:predicted phage terminase large subunit-like protein
MPAERRKPGPRVGAKAAQVLALSPRDVEARLMAAKIEQARRSLHRFLRDFAWPVLQPGTEFVDNWHVGAMCEHLQAVSEGQIKRLVINLPFRMLKSTIVSQAFPAWEWIDRPHLQYLTASYAKDVATRDAVDSRRIIESPLYQAAWGEKYRMTSDQNVKTRYENDKRGSRVVTATDAAGTGFGGNRIIVDDPVSALEADSAVKIATSIEWWKGTASTRLNNPETDAIVVVHQRLNQEDLTGYILANEAALGWEHLVLPMRYDKALVKTTSLGYRDPRTKQGELLSPKRLSEATVKEMEARLGKYHTEAQLQQNPGSREGVIFKLKDWNFYHAWPKDMAGEMDEIIWSWDCSFKESLGSDPVSGLCIGRKGSRKYLLARINDQMSFSKTKAAILNAASMLPFSRKLIAVLVEDKANGPAVIDALEADVAALTPITPQGGKVVRANAVQPQHEAGDWYLPSPTLKGYEWINDFTALFAKFPGVPHDDDVDAWTQGCNWFTTRENQESKSPDPVVGGHRTY